MQKNCQNCAHNHTLSDGEQSQLICRRYPPKLTTMQRPHPMMPQQMEFQTITIFPAVTPDMVCGEHKSPITVAG